MLTLQLKTTRIIYKKDNLNNHSVAPTLCHGKEYSQITGSLASANVGRAQVLSMLSSKNYNHYGKSNINGWHSVHQR